MLNKRGGGGGGKRRRGGGYKSAIRKNTQIRLWGFGGIRGEKFRNWWKIAK